MDLAMILYLLKMITKKHLLSLTNIKNRISHRRKAFERL